MKKILCVLLVVLMCLTSAPLGGFADLDLGITASALNATGKCGENATYTFDSATGVLVISGTGAIFAEFFYENKEIKNVIIEDGITAIGTDTFNSSLIESVTIGKDVTTIGESAFYNCDSLTSVNIGDSVTTIGSEAFTSCNSLTSVDIGDSVTTIGAWAFRNCNSLTSVNIGDSVTTIGNSAFAYCNSLTSVDIPDSVTTIVGTAFYGCSSLEYVNIPKSVTSIGDQAFRYCSGLRDVYYAGSEAEWNEIRIGSYNTALENAVIHFDEEFTGCIHRWNEATCTASKTCVICGETDGYALDHIYSEEKVLTIAPTCTTAGEKANVCLICARKKSGSEEVVPISHNYPSTWSVLITPDCQNTGFAVKVCFSCHDVIAQVVPKAGHADNDGDSHCDTCNCEIIVEEPEIPDEPADDSADEPADEPEEKPCDCNCHAGGIKAFFFKLTNFFAKIFSKDARTCKCGESH